MTKMRNPGFLSNEERLYLRSIQAGTDPRRGISNPSRVRARILDFRRKLHNAIEVLVEDVGLIGSAGQLSDDCVEILPFTPQQIEQDLARSVIANRIGFLKYFFLDDPLFYLLVVCLDTITRASPNQKQALLENVILCLRLAEAPKELAKKDAGFDRRISSYRETLALLDEVIVPLREELSRNVEGKREAADWFVEHTNEKDALLVLFSKELIAGSHSKEEAEKEVGMHRDKMSEILDVPKRRVTRLLSTLGKKDFVRRRNHRYFITVKGKDAAMFLLVSSPNMYSIIEDYAAMIGVA